MFAVVVTLRVAEGQMDAFLPLMLENARASRETEKGCRQFDVCPDGHEVFLYELYDDRAAFDDHLASDHFKSFDAEVTDLVVEKSVRTFDKVLR